MKSSQFYQLFKRNIVYYSHNTTIANTVFEIFIKRNIRVLIIN